MSDSLIIVFVKNPEKGKVKTRLAATIGDDEALHIYNKLLELTKAAVDPVKADVAIYYHREIGRDDLWNGYNKYLQEGKNLGEKLANAFQNHLDDYQKIIVIGSDCPDISAEILNEGIYALNNHDFALGPALDGGYYLLGMKHFLPTIFEDIAWSTDKVLEQTLDKIANAGRSYHLLPYLRDIDDENDLRKSTLEYAVGS